MPDMEALRVVAAVMWRIYGNFAVPIAAFALLMMFASFRRL